MERLEVPIEKKQQSEHNEVLDVNLDVIISRITPEQIKLLIDSGEEIHFLITSGGKVYLDPEFRGDIMKLNDIKEEDIINYGKFFKDSSTLGDKITFVYSSQTAQYPNLNTENAIIECLNRSLGYNLTRGSIH